MSGHSIQAQRMHMVRVDVTAGAKKEKVERREGGYRVSVREAALRGAANRRVRELVAEGEGVVLSRVRLLTGGRSSRKRFVIK